MRTGYVISLIAIMLLFGGNLLAQVTPGTPPWASLNSGPFDVVNLGSLNGHFDISVRSKAGRVTPFTYDITYDTSIWYPTTVNGQQTWQPASAYGWNFPTIAAGYLTNQTVATVTEPCDPPNNMNPITFYVYAYWTYHDIKGGTHPTNITNNNLPPNNGCTNFGQPSSGTTTDGSQYTINVAAGSGSATVTGTDGKLYSLPINPSTTVSTTTDANGNEITSDASGNITDTLGTVALSASGISPKTFKYTAPNGSTATWTMNYTSYNIKTNFGCSGVAEYTANGVSLPTSLVLPDGTEYQFTYENTVNNSGYKTGRLASVTLPTGGSITYTYPTINSGANNGINCSDGSAPASVNGNASFTRTLSPGGTWTYYRTQVSGNHWQTKMTSPPDPSVGNDTVIDFQQDSSTSQYGNTHDFFEVQRKEYQGSASSNSCSGTITSNCLLRTSITCWNTANPTPGNCPTTSVSTLISRQTIFSYLPDTSSSSKVSETDIQWTQYSDPSLPNEIDSYDYGTGSPGAIIRKVINSYRLIGNTVQITGTSIEDANNNVKASTGFAYDTSTPTTTTGTPQHTTPPSERGNLTILSQEVSGSLTLYRVFTYYDTGMLNTATDWGTTTSGGANITTYNYSTGSCGNSFPISISEPLNLTESFTWDCNGGVQTSATDENGQTTTTYYAQTSNYGSPDPNFWRPYAATDQLNNATTLTYPFNTVSESALLFNSNHSVVDQRTKLDAFGRPILSQMKEGPSSSEYDSTQTDYDNLGRISKTYLPFTNTQDVACSGTCPGVVESYDALYRPVATSDSGGGSTTWAYTNTDVLQVVGPAPSGENKKQRQLEYDGLGRVSSVCELTSSGNGGGTCSQYVTQTGFWTKYTYDVLGNINGVTQNAQAATSSQQTRTYNFDMAGRLTSELNPETGSSAIAYTYDTADSTCGSYSSPGDLVEKKDAMGNYTCYKYDALHRVTQTNYPSGSYASVTPTKCYVYDSATVDGTAMANAKARLAEAYTTSASSCPGTVTVDESFSYSARGEVSDVYEKTPDSGGYYHVNATFWAHGRLNVLNGGSNPLPGLPAITYGASDGSGLDGKGRITKVNAASGQNPATSISWNAGNQITGVTFGSSDSDSYQYDPITGRMTQYQFNMGTGPQTQTGVLTWNGNGTLGKLQITDQINTANSQTCTYSHDDLMRIIAANCGSAWSQTFSFDPFGNLSKSGSAQFLPTYTGASGTNTSPTNQYYQISGGGSGTSNYYDSNGNLKNDVTHTYTWDADGNMLSTDGSTVTMIYDAMDRMIEQTRGSSHTEIAYGPYGLKLALMNGQTLVSAFVKLPGGSRAVYGSGGLAYYRHADHLGNSRLATTPSRAKYYDVSYAPYGEDYDGSGTQDLAFTDENQDTVKNGWSTNLYDFMLREYRTAHGRWTSPDPAGLGVVDPTNPQTWNRFAYVLNNPMAAIDLLGDDTCYNPDGTPFDCDAQGNPTGNCPECIVSVNSQTGCANGACSSDSGNSPYPTPVYGPMGPIGPFVGINYPGMSGMQWAAKQATRGYPTVTKPKPPIPQNEKPPELNPPKDITEIPKPTAIFLKFLEMLDGLTSISIPIMGPVPCSYANVPGCVGGFGGGGPG